MNKESIFSVLNGLGLSKILRSQKKNMLTVLSLHRVSPELDFFWNPMKPDTFERLLQYLQKHYHVISFNDLQEIQKKQRHTKPYVILSFDDGYYDFYEYALPLLVQYKMPANHNIVNECAENNRVIWTQRLNTIFNFCRTSNLPLSFEKDGQLFNKTGDNNNWMQFYLAVYKWMLTLTLGERQALLAKQEQSLSLSASVKMMNWQQIAECANNGIEIGSHSFSHDVISTITNDDVLYKEIVTSVKQLEEKLNKKINILALPNGEGNAAIAKYLDQAGINYLLYVGEKLNAMKKLNGTMDSIYRINLVEESVPAMMLRTEMFHAKMKNYV